MTSEHTIRGPDYTREDLIELCDRAIVPEANWHNRDSAAAQMQLGTGRALLKAGCRFVINDPDERGSTILSITYDGFERFEYGVGHEDVERFYIPTPETLEGLGEGEEWY